MRYVKRAFAADLDETLIYHVRQQARMLVGGGGPGLKSAYT